jgi:hypothetical protein
LRLQAAGMFEQEVSPVQVARDLRATAGAGAACRRSIGGEARRSPRLTANDTKIRGLIA